MLNEAFTAKGLFFSLRLCSSAWSRIIKFPMGNIWKSNKSNDLLHSKCFCESRNSAVIQKNGSIATLLVAFMAKGIYSVNPYSISCHNCENEHCCRVVAQQKDVVWLRGVLWTDLSPTSKCHSQFSSPLLGCKGLPCFGKTWAKCWFNVVAQLIKGRYFELQMCQLCCRHPTDVCDTGFLQVLILRYPHFVWCENGRVRILVFEIQKALDSNVNPELRYEKRGTVKTRDLTEKSFLFANRLKLERRS